MGTSRHRSGVYLLLGLGSVVGCAAESGSSTAAPQAADFRSGDKGRASPICEPVPVPETQPGARLGHFVEAIVATDPSRRERFVDEEMSDGFLAAVPRERHITVLNSLHNDGRPILLCRIESSTPTEVVAILGGSDEQGTAEYGRFFVTVDGPAGQVSSLGIEPANEEDLTRKIEPLDEADLREIVDDVAEGLRGYVFADKAEMMGERMRQALAAGGYASIDEPRALARRLTDDLVAVSGDKHLRVIYSASKLPQPRDQQGMTPEQIERSKEHAAADNFGMPVAEIRVGNVGYLKVLGFLPPEVAAEAVEKTISKLADADALIIDLRQNGGGSPHGVALMTSYLFGKKPVHLNDIYHRGKDRTESFHTSPDAPGKHFGGRKPIFVLTSSRTFSAGEEFAYNLKALGRATIVGEVTGGGAHPTEFVRVSDHWGVALPSARAINPITKTNWEGAGVEPDIEVSADQALDEALRLVKEANAPKRPRGSGREEAPNSPPNDGGAGSPKR